MTRVSSLLILASTLAVHVRAAGVTTIPVSKLQTIYSFGDSLSDDGNATILTLGLEPGANYAPGRFTDGSNTNPAVPPGGPQGVWVEQLAGKLHLADPSPVLSGGTDYAVASARSGSANPQDVGNQITLFDLFHFWSAPKGGLYTFWAGANDILDNPSTSTAITAANNVMNDITHLSNEGAKYFLWLNLPPLGVTPEGQSNAAALDADTNAYDAQWSKDLTTLQNKGIDVVGVNIDQLFTTIESVSAGGCTPGPSNPYCFANITTPAQGKTGINPDTYLFWDDLHPTTEADSLVALWSYDAMMGINPLANVDPLSVDDTAGAISPTPEPTAMTLAALGLLSLLILRRLVKQAPASQLPKATV